MADENSTPSGPPAGGGKNTGMAIVAYFIFFVPLLTEDKNDPFVKFHVKQALVLLLLGVAIGVLFSIVGIIMPFMFLLYPIVWIGWLVLWILGIMNAAKGEMKKVPLVGQFSEMFKF